MLSAIALFAVIGMSSSRFGRRQQALISAVAVGLVMLQFAFPRYL